MIPNKLKNHWTLLLLILLLAAVLRVWQLDKVPIELFGDEIDVGIQAYSILKTGKDYFSHPFPLMFQSFAEYRLPVLIYSAVPTIAVFGLNEWGVRMPAVIFGLLSIFGIFLLSKHLFNANVGLISAFLMSISPWHIHFSRWSNDAIGLLVFMLFGAWTFLLGLKRSRILFVAAIIFSLSLYTYSIALVFMPLFILVLASTNRKQLLQIGVKKISFTLILLFIFATPYLVIFFSGASSERFSKISVVNDQGLRDSVINNQSQSPPPLNKIIYNKFSVISREIIKNYLESFSIQYLFTRGDPIFRHSVSDMGEMYVYELFFLSAGFIWLIKNLILKTSRESALLVIVWLLIAPIAASLTKDGGNHSGRLIVMIAPLLLVTSLGINWLVCMKRKNLNFFLCLIFIFAIVNIAHYFLRYYTQWSQESFRFWQYGYKQAMTYLKENDAKYSRVYFNNTYEPALPRFLFWYRFDPSEFHKLYQGSKGQKDIVPGFDGFRLGDKYYFGTVNKLIEDQGIADVLRKDHIYMVSVRDEVGTADWVISPPKNVKIVKTIVSPLKAPIFFLVIKK